MKFLDNLELENVSGVLSHKELSTIVIRGRLEAFSCDHTGGNNGNSPLSGDVFSKKDLKIPSFDQQGKNTSTNDSTFASVVPSRKRSFSLSECKQVDIPKRRRSMSLGDTVMPSKKVLFDLVAALGELFPDYDYRFTSSFQFVSKNVNQMVSEVNGYLAEITETDPAFLENLWRSIDMLMNLNSSGCEVYIYSGDKDDDGPLNDRKSLWSFHFFILSRDLHRLCYFGCKANSKLQKYLHTISDGEEEDDLEEDADRSFDLGHGLTPNKESFPNFESPASAMAAEEAAAADMGIRVALDSQLVESDGGSDSESSGGEEDEEEGAGFVSGSDSDDNAPLGHED